MRYLNRYRQQNKPMPDYPSGVRKDDDSNIGFGLGKVLDKKSIFCGIPSLNTIAAYVEIAIDHWHLIPTPEDGKFLSRAKTVALIWRGLRSINVNRAAILERADLEEIDFGLSRDTIFDLINEVMDPDEVFKPQGHAPFTPPYDLYRYPIKDGFMYWVFDRESEMIRRIMLTGELSKNDILELLWEKLGRVIQLEADDGGLSYVPTELTQKKIFGSSNELIAQLQEDYKYFRENKLSRGYLLIGKPGTGKTAIINALVDSSDGRVFIISGLDCPGTVEQMESLFIQMRPDFIIFDDCDRSQNSPDFIKAVLRMLETVKDRNPHTNFLFTANTFSGILYDEAVTRKGRIDQIYEVPEPIEVDRKEIFQRYATEMGVTLSEEDLEKCVTLSDGMTGADIQELCIQLQRATLDEVFERAREIEVLREKYSGDDYDDAFLEDASLRRNLAMALTKRMMKVRKL